MRATLTLLLTTAVAFAVDPPNVAVIAIVNGEEIKANEVDRILANRPKGSSPLTASLVADLRRAVLDDLIDEKLIKQFLVNEKIVVSDADVDQQLKVLVESLAKKGSSLESYRKETGQTDSEMREQFRTLIGFERFADRNGTSDELKKFHALHKDYFDGVKVRAEAILVRVPRAATDGEKAIGRERAVAIAKQCQADPANFAKWSKEMPYHPGSAELGWLTRFDSLVEDAIADNAFALKVNAVSQPIELPGGWAIVKSFERSTPQPRPFESIQDWVKETYSGSLRTVVIARLRQSATIKKTES